MGHQKVKILFVGTVPQKQKISEEVIGRNSSTKKIVKRLLVGTVPPKSEDIICRNSSTKKIVKKLLVGTVPPKKIVKRLLVGTVPPKNSEEVISRNSPPKK